MSTSELQSNANEVEQLRAQVETLEKLLEVYEQETIDKSNRLERTLAELRDHTQRLTHAESTLATLRLMLNNIGDAVVVIDQRGKILFLNPAAESLLGISPSCSSWQEWSQSWSLYYSDQETRYSPESFPLTQAIRGECPLSTEVFARTQSRDGHWFSVTARSLYSPSGDIEGGIAVFHNITHLKQTEMALRQSEAYSKEQALQLQQALNDIQNIQIQLVQTEKMSSLGQMIAGICHEINNPVNFIHGNLTHVQNYVQDLLNLIGLFQECYPDADPAIQDEAEAIDLEFILEDLPKTLASMKVGSKRICEIVLSLRNFSRTDETEFNTIDIHEGIESTLLILQHRLKAKPERPAIAIHREYGSLPAVECLPGQLNQVFMNIVANAIDAMESKPAKPGETDQITLRTAVIDAQWVEIAIADSGGGIPEAIQARIFEPFFTTKPVGKGTGIGMSISHQIITEKHGGKLQCNSTPGQGTEFVIQIPIRQQA